MKIKSNKESASSPLAAVAFVTLVALVIFVVINEARESTRATHKYRRATEIHATAVASVVEQSFYSKPIVSLGNGLHYISETNGHKAFQMTADYANKFTNEQVWGFIKAEKASDYRYLTAEYYAIHSLVDEFKIDKGFFFILKPSTQQVAFAK